MILTKSVTYYGKQVPVSELSVYSTKRVEVLCPDCKEIRTVAYSRIAVNGHCKCQKCVLKTYRKDFPSGTKIGRLTVLKASKHVGKSICKCDCGTVKEVLNTSLQKETTLSCGCLRSDNARNNIAKLARHQTRENHPNWKGGVTYLRECAMQTKDYKDWRKNVFERDDFTCKKCNQKGYDLNAHHIMSYAEYPKLRLDVENGVTLCKECHIEFHKQWGRKTNKNQLQIFMNN